MRDETNGQLLRIYIGEADTWRGKPLYQQIVEQARKQQLAGVTVTRGIEGFGASSRIHKTSALAVRQDTPLVIELADSEEKLKGFLPTVDEMVNDGLVTLNESRLILYRQPSTA
jgi:hypothetical protein